MTDTMTATNQYVTVRTVGLFTMDEEFYVSTITYSGETHACGRHGYAHKRSARRAAIALAKKLDVSYRQDMEYSDNPQAFIARATT